MIRPARPNADFGPKPQPAPKPKPKTLAQEKADFTAEGAPPLDPALPAAAQPATQKKTLPQTPAPPAAALARLLSGSHRN